MVVSQEVDAANRLRWEQGRSGHYEVYYLTFNHRASGSGFWIRYTMTAPDKGKGDAYAQIWFSYFNRANPAKNFALKQKYPIGQLKAETTPFRLQIGGNTLENGHADGAISGNGHEAQWDVSFDPSNTVHLMMPRIFVEKELADTTALVPHLDVCFEGKISVDGEALEFGGDPGCQTHLWGDEHARRWAWAHCNSYNEDPSAVFEGLSVQIKRAGIMLPPINLLFIRYMGKDYRFTELHRFLSAGGSFDVGHWKFNAALGNVKFKGEMKCRDEDMVSAGYFDPDGEPAYCNNTEVGDSKIEVYKRRNLLSSWKLVDTLTADGTAHMEFASRKREARVEKEIEEV